MSKKAQSKELDTKVLYRALRIAAIEAYHSEVIETDRFSELIGTDKEFPTIDFWIRHRINSWMQEAELLLEK